MTYPIVIPVFLIISTIANAEFKALWGWRQCDLEWERIEDDMRIGSWTIRLEVKQTSEKTLYTAAASNSPLQRCRICPADSSSRPMWRVQRLPFRKRYSSLSPCQQQWTPHPWQSHFRVRQSGDQSFRCNAEIVINWYIHIYIY